MPKEPARRFPTAPPDEGPIRPGSPLYRVLEMIMREIARDALAGRPVAIIDKADETE